MDLDVQSWFKDPEFKALPFSKQRSILSTFFEAEYADDDFRKLERQEQASIRNNFVDQNLAPHIETADRPGLLGLVRDASSAVAGGVVGAGAWPGAAQGLYRMGDEPDFEDHWTENAKRFLEDWRMASPSLRASLQAREGVRRWVYEGLQSAVQSLVSKAPSTAAGAAAGSAIPVVGPFVGGVAGYVLGGGTLYGISAWNDFLREADQQGLDRRVSEPAAIKYGIVEGGFEFVSDILEVIFLGVARPITTPGKAALKAGIRDLVKARAGDILVRTAGVIASETSTEMATSGIQAEIDRGVGLGDQRFWDAAADAFGPAFVASLIFSGVGTGIRVAENRKIVRDLTDPERPKKQRMQSVLQVARAIHGVDPDLSSVWTNSAAWAVQNKQAISSEEDLTGEAYTKPKPAADILSGASTEVEKARASQAGEKQHQTEERAKAATAAAEQDQADAAVAAGKDQQAQETQARVAEESAAREEQERIRAAALEAEAGAVGPSLSPGQIEDLSQRVAELGSVEAVDRAYPDDDIVSVIARSLARRVFGEQRETEEGFAPREIDGGTIELTGPPAEEGFAPREIDGGTIELTGPPAEEGFAPREIDGGTIELTGPKPEGPPGPVIGGPRAPQPGPAPEGPAAPETTELTDEEIEDTEPDEEAAPEETAEKPPKDEGPVIGGPRAPKPDTGPTAGKQASGWRKVIEDGYYKVYRGKDLILASGIAADGSPVGIEFMDPKYQKSNSTRLKALKVLEGEAEKPEETTELADEEIEETPPAGTEPEGGANEPVKPVMEPGPPVVGGPREPKTDKAGPETTELTDEEIEATEPDTEVDEGEAEAGDKEDLGGKKGKKGKKRGKKLKDVGEERWKRSSKDGKERTEAIELELTGDIPEGTPAKAIVKALLRKTNKANIFKITPGEDTSPGTGRYLRLFRGQIPGFLTWAGERFGGSKSKRYINYDTALTRVFESGSEDRKKNLLNMAAQYISVMELLNESVAEASTVMAARDGMVEVLFTEAAWDLESLSHAIPHHLKGYMTNPGLIFYDVMGADYKHKTRVFIRDFFTSQALEFAEKQNDPDKELQIVRTSRRIEDIETDARHRKGNVTGQDLIETFNLGAVMYGDWAESAHRQISTNLTFDSFHDLAEAMGAPPMGVSLNRDKRLGIAFGARGHGGRAAATFYPGDNTINLTKTKGDGSLAHEWGHGLDHMANLSLADNTNPDYRHYNPIEDLKLAMQKYRDLAGARAEVEKILLGMHSRFYRVKDRLEAARTFLENHWKAAFEKKTRFYQNAVSLDGGKEGGYWSSAVEMFARGFEAWVADKMQGSNMYLVDRDFVAPGAVEEKFLRRFGAYPTAEERDRFNALFDHLFDGITWSEDGVPSMKPDYVPVTFHEILEGQKVVDDLLDKLEKIYNSLYQGEVSADGLFWYAFKHTSRGMGMQPKGFMAFDDVWSFPEDFQAKDEAQGEKLEGTGAVGYPNPLGPDEIIGHGLVAVTHENPEGATYLQEGEDGTIYGVRTDGEGPLGEVSAEDDSPPRKPRGAGDGAVGGPRGGQGRDSGTGVVGGPRIHGGQGDGAETPHIPPGRGDDADLADEPDAVQSAGRADYSITEADHLSDVPPQEIFTRNLAAIQVLKQIEAEDRLATPDEQAVLVQYSGWGGCSQALEYAPLGAWRGRAELLARNLTDEEMSSLRRSTQNAFYTPPHIIQFMYDALQRMGFLGGRVVEPSCGVGHFMGMMPAEVRRMSTLVGVELDSISARIAGQLYQNQTILHSPFQDAQLPDNFYDLVISNVPFGEETIFDRKHNPLGFVIHDYFINKSLAVTRPGGLVAVITSMGTMDKGNSKAREAWAEDADLVMALRLPNGTFAANSNTEVATDILFLRKKGPNTAPVQAQAWQETQGLEVPVLDNQGHALQGQTETITINEYFIKNPDHILGFMGHRGGWRSSDKKVAGDTDPGTISARLGEILETVPPAIYMKADVGHVLDLAEAVPLPGQVLDNAFFEGEDGNLYRNMGGKPVAYDTKTAEKKNNALRVRGMIRVRGLVRQILRAQIQKMPDKELAVLRKKLNAAYDAFVKKHGWLNDQRNVRLFAEDPDAGTLMALEQWDYDDLKSTGKAAIFTKNTIQDVEPPTSADGAMEALVQSLNFRGRVDLAFMSKLTGLSRDHLVRDLGDSVFNDPQAGWVPAYIYLSGFVRDKLRVAQQAAKTDKQFERNVKALEAAQPKDLTPADIRAKLGATWVNPKYIEDFIAHLVGDYDVKVDFEATLGKWFLSWRGKSNAAADRAKKSAKKKHAATHTWGTGQAHFYTLMDFALNGGLPKIYTPPDADGHTRLDVEQTEAANAKLVAIQDRFAAWLWENDSRARDMVDVYNQRLNNHVDTQFDGSHLTFPGKVPDEVFGFRPYQKNAVWRFLTNGVSYLGHEVGLGKTAVMAACCMESRRLGLARRPMMSVMKANLDQVRAEILRLYPAARVLHLTLPENVNQRKAQLARIAMSEADIVLVTHDAMKKIPLLPETVSRFIARELRDLEAALVLARQTGAAQYTVKGIAKAKTRLEEKLKESTEQRDKYEIPSFEEMGIDLLCVDEAQVHKNLAFHTEFQGIRGLNPDGSDIAMDLFLKTSYLHQQYGRGVLLASGTPVSNSVAEVYSISKYLHPEELRRKGLWHFDNWANTFGVVRPEPEYAPEGGGFRMVTKFAKFVNVPELMQMVRIHLDLQRADDHDIVRPGIMSGKPIAVVVPQNEAVAAYQDTLKERAIEIRRKPRDATHEGSPDIMFRVINDGRNMAMDPRLHDPSLPDFPNTKTNYAVRKVLEIHGREFDAADQKGKPYKEKKGVQLVFCDRGVPGKKGKGFSVYEDMRAKLVAGGIPAKEIAFIHDYSPVEKKRSLFAKVRSGAIRVLIGSTKKMGTGVNVQTRVVAMHHLDVDWNQANYEQRNGRGWRWGNQVKEIQIYNYGTEATVDAFMWGKVADKAKVIGQILSSDPQVREVEDISQESMNASEMLAVIANDPLQSEQVQLTASVHSLRSEKSVWQSGMRRMEWDLRAIPAENKNRRTRQEAGEKYLALLDSIDAIQIGDVFFDLSKEGGKANAAAAKIHGGKKLQKALKDKLDARKTVGTYGRIEVETVPVEVTEEYTETVDGKPVKKTRTVTREDKIKKFVEGPILLRLRHDPWSGGLAYVVESLSHNYQDDQNIAGGVSRAATTTAGRARDYIERMKAEIQEAEDSIPALKAAIQEPFAKQEELLKKELRLAEVTRLLLEQQANRETEIMAGKAAREAREKKPGKEIEEDLDEDAQYSTKTGPNALGEALTLDEVRALFPGQEVGVATDGSVWIRTREGHGVNIRSVKKIKGNRLAMETAFGPAADLTRPIAGRYLKGEILLDQTMGGQWVLAHESIHWLEDIGLLTERDVAIVRDKIKQLHRRGKWTPNNPDDVGGPEDRADWLADRWTSKPSGPLGKILAKIREFVDRLINLVKRTPEGIARDIKTGKVFEKGAPATKGQARAPAYDQTAARWYSQMEKHLGEKLPGKGKPGDLARMVRTWGKKGMFKAEELDWSGVLEWLAEQTGTVTKDQVLAYLRENNVRVEEVVKGDGAEKVWFLEYKDHSGRLGSPYKSRQEAEAALKETGLEDKIRVQAEYTEVPANTKFASYQEPGGENYRELLLVMPVTVEKRGPGNYIARTMGTAAWGANEESARMEAGEFRSSHWDEPNVLVHVRFNERVDAQGRRVLFVEEVQSDWHQTGRKKGYQGLSEKERLRKEELERHSIGEWSSEDTDWYNAIVNDREGRGVPDAPFKGKAWPLLAMKRMIRWAAENGFDAVAWTPGEVQAGRYDLSKHIDSLNWEKLPNGKYNISPIKDNAGVGLPAETKGITIEQIENLVGKDIAQKIESQAGKNWEGGGVVQGTLSGLDLKIGGEGMRAFYDEMLPAAVNKFVKKWGGKVEPAGRVVTWDTDEAGYEFAHNVPAHTLPITRAMRAAALREGMPLFSYAGKRALTSDRSGLGRASNMHRDGESMETIRQATGWFLWKDGKWRFEIDDSAIDLKGINLDSSGVGETITALVFLADHPALYRAYPTMEDILVNVLIDPDLQYHRGSYKPGEDRSPMGLFNRSPEIQVFAKDLEDAKGVLLHEIQHGIQDIEGFASGGSPAAMDSFRMTVHADGEDVTTSLFSLALLAGKRVTSLQDGTTTVSISPETRKKFEGIWSKEIRAINSKLKRYKRDRTIERETRRRDEIAQALDTLQKKDSWEVTVRNSPGSQYERLAGEVEARDTADRRDMTREDRRRLEPYVSQGIPDSDIIVKMERDRAEQLQAEAEDDQAQYSVARVNEPLHVERDLMTDRSFANRIWEQRDTAVHGVHLDVMDLQKRLQEMVPESKRRVKMPWTYAPTKRTSASDLLDQALMVWRDLQREPDKAADFRAWATGKLGDAATPAREKIRIREQLAILKRVDELTDQEKDLAREIGVKFERAYTVAVANKVVASHQDYYVRRLWKFTGKKGETYAGPGARHGFKTHTSARKQRTLETILDGWMEGFELGVRGLTNSYGTYMEELETILANKDFVMAGRRLRDGAGSRLFETSKKSGYAPLQASGFAVWEWAGKAQVEVGPDDDQALFVSDSGRGFFLAPVQRIEHSWAVYADQDAERPSKVFRDKDIWNEWTEEYETIPGQVLAEEWAQDKGYTRIEYRPAKDVSEAWERRVLYAPAQIADIINRMTRADTIFRESPGLSVLARFNAMIKGWILLSSFFHHMAGSRSWIFGVHHGWKKGRKPKAFADRGLELPGWNPVRGYKMGLAKIEGRHPILSLGIRHGLTLGELQDWAESSLREDRPFAERLARYLGMEKTAKGVAAAERWRQNFTDSLFKKFFAGLKAEAFVVEYVHELRKAHEKHRAGRGPAVDVNAVAERVSRLINADFGGLHLQRMGRSPTLQKVARLVLLAPDWTESNFRTVTGMVPGLNNLITRAVGDVPPPQGMDGIYRAFWGRVALRIAVSTILTQMLLNGGDDSEEFWAEQVAPENLARKRWTAVDVSKIYRALGIDLPEGRRKVLSLGGHFLDPLKIFEPWTLIKHKGSPAVRAASALVTGSDWRDRPYTGAKELATTGKLVKKSPYDKEAGELDRLPSTLTEQIINMQPIQVGEAIAYFMGEADGLTALLRSAGVAVSTAYKPRETLPVSRGEIPEDVARELDALHDAGALSMGQPSRTFHLNGVPVKLPEEMYRKYVDASSRRAAPKLKTLVHGPRWDNLGPEDRSELVGKIVSSARKKERQRMKRMNARKLTTMEEARQ